MIKRMSTLILSGVMFFSANCFAAQGTSVVINGADFTDQVVWENDVLFAPYDVFSKSVGYPAYADDIKNTGNLVILNDDNYCINIPVFGGTTVSYYTAKDKELYTYEHHTKELPAPVKNENGTYLIPIIPICEILGLTYGLNNETNTLTINSKKVPQMVTKSQLEAAGKGPDSVNWRYQEDYLANRPIPESALIYKNPVETQPTTNSTGEKMVTKSQLEAEGKGPDSVNWRYQEDYLANKPIPESALIYKQKNNTFNSVNNNDTVNENNNNGDGSVVESGSDYLISRYISGLETIGDAIGWIGDKLTK
ncbi:MAG: hypothetical protein Q4F63_02145 [Clostridia bacterium]|nr:hypothetical protein [Clostridia bacterium]